ncbi:MAG TPA: RNA polymerase sigma factor, partial [Puia sp.]|nr:RNA polymerase sigma factor [Puia sp.]
MDRLHSPALAEASMATDAELIARIISGEKELYALIIRRYNTRLYRVGMSMINDDVEVEDIMQATYIRAYENLRSFEFRSALATWLTRILINECLLRMRKRKWFIPTDGENPQTEIKSTMHTPASRAVNTELRGILEEAVRGLPEKYRTVFVMREIEDMSVAETQSCLDISAVNVKVRLNRAKALLRTALSRYYDKEDILQFHNARCDRMVETVIQRISSK